MKGPPPPKPEAELSPRDLKQWRRRLGMSVEQFASFLGTTRGHNVRRWESGTNVIPPYIDLLYELAVLSPNIEKWMANRGIQEWNRRLDARLIEEPENDTFD